MSDKLPCFVVAAPAVAAVAASASIVTPLYITDDNQTALQLRRGFAGALQNAMLPRVLPLSALHNAAAMLPLSASVDLICDVAEFSSWSAADNHRSLTMEIDAVLREQWTTQSSDADILSAAAALAGLLAEFVDEHPDLLPSDEALPQLCEKLPSALADEGNIISALWECLKNGHVLASRRGLHAFAQQSPPLVYVGDISNPPWLPNFLRHCKSGCTIYTDTVTIPDSASAMMQINTAADMPASASDMLMNAMRGELLDSELSDSKKSDSQLSDSQTVLYLPQECREGASASLNQAAMMALTIVREYAADSQAVGVVVYDRLLARRLRAAAENDGVFIEDDGGWRMETLSFGGALRQWADTVIHPFSAAQFGRLLRPPFWHGYPHRDKALAEWRKILADGVLPKSWAEAAGGGTTAAQFAEVLYQIHLRMPAALPAPKGKAAPQSAPLRDWINWLLDESGTALAAWRNDAVAVPLRGALNMAAAGDGVNVLDSPDSKKSHDSKNHSDALNSSDVLDSPDSLLTATAFRQWLAWFMENQTGGRRDVRSCVSFVTPATKRQFEGGLILLGAHAENLPTQPPHFFGEKRRVHLNLPGRSEWMARQLSQFSRLLAGHKRVAAVWHDSGHGGRPMPPSPLWMRFTDVLKNANRAVESITLPVDVRISADINPPQNAAAIARKMPETISITGLENLMKCPYHFYATNMLRLDEDDEDEFLSAMAQGRLLHKAMKHFAESAVGKTDVADLQQCWHDAFAMITSGRAGARMAILHWRQQGDAFLLDENRRRKEGWRVMCAEEKMTETLATDLGEVQLRGKLDRLDCCDSGDGKIWEVVDYKSGSLAGKNKMQSGEAPQLPLYAALSGHADANWRLCAPTKGKNTETSGDAAAIADGLREILRQIGRGAIMPANGALSACRDCASRRLCRRDHIVSENESAMLGKINNTKNMENVSNVG